MRNRNIFRGKNRLVSGVSVSVGYQLPYWLKSATRVSDLSREARVRLKVLEFGENHPVAVTCRHFGISRATYYRWKQRYDPKRLNSLENRSKRPKNVRKPSWTLELIEKIQDLRGKYPAWGKAKLIVLLRREGVRTSESTVGRILRYLKKRGVLKEPAKRVKAWRTRKKRFYAIRKPKDYRVKTPGDIVQIDTLDIRPLPGSIYKQFSAVDVVSRYGFADVRSRATAAMAKEFLEQLVSESPFTVKAVQTDGGSEFHAEFEQACKEMGLQFFCLPPRSPKLNGSVERFNRTSREEYWNIYDGDLGLESMRPALRQWMKTEYNGVRPHQALGYLTPAEYLENLRAQGVSHVLN